MPALQNSIMDKLYGQNIWTGLDAREGDELKGWNGDHPSLSRLTSVDSAKIVVDVGVWKGQSTITMARAMRDNGIDGVVISVDTFLGSPEHFRQEPAHFALRNGMPDLYWIFMSNIINAGLQDYVIPIPQTSSTAAKILKRFVIQPAVIHIDAAHEYREVVSDLDDYWELLSPGGYLIGDDYHEAWPGIIQAVGEFSARRNRVLTIETPKFILRK